MALPERPGEPGEPSLRWLWRLSAAEWRAHPWRQAVAVLSVALGVALALSVHLINESALAEFGAAMQAAEGRPDLVLQGGPDGLDEVWLDRLALQPGVAQAHPRLEIDTAVLLPDGRSQALKLIGIDALALAAVAPELMPRPDPGAAPGRLAMLDPDLVFVNAALAAALAGRPELDLVARGQPRRWTVGGRVAAGGPPLAVLDIAAAQQAFGHAGRVSRIDLRLRTGVAPATLQRDVEAAGSALPAGARWQTPDDEQRQASALSRAYRVNLTVLAGVALVVGGFLVFSVVSLAVAQRTPALALLGVLGLGAAGRRRLILGECLLTGGLAAGLGVAGGTGLAWLALRMLAGDLGGGYFAGVTPALHFSWAAAALCAGLGVAAALAGGAWPAWRAAQLSPARALKGLGGDTQGLAPAWPGIALLALGAGLAALPPIAGLPLAAYVAVAAWLVGGIALVPVAVQALLGRRGERPARHPLWLLALQRARNQRATATAAVAGVVASLALCVALTVMVASFRSAVDDWLGVVLPADLYLRAGAGSGRGDQVFFPTGLVPALGRLPGVQRVGSGRSRSLQLSPTQPEVWLLARPLGPQPQQQLSLVTPLLDLPPAALGVFVSEALAELYGARPGTWLSLPLSGPAGAWPALYVRGVYRDYAHQFGSLTLDSQDEQRLSGEARLNELSLWLAPDTAQAPLEAAIRAELSRLGGTPQTLALASTAQLRAMSLQIFDRSFAVTRYLQAVAIAIGLAGVAASLSAQVLARQREFGLMAHLGLDRSQVWRLVIGETAGWLAAGLVVGLLLGLAISALLVQVVNPQSFHWTMPMRVPLGPLAALLAAVGLSGLVTSALAARHALSADAVRAVKEDW